MRTPKPKHLSEAEVTDQVVAWMAGHCYTAERQNVGMANYGARGRVSYGTKGGTDFIFTHPKLPAVYIELKKQGEIPYTGFAKPDDPKQRREWTQENYRLLRRSQGFRAFWCNSLEMLEAEMAKPIVK